MSLLLLSSFDVRSGLKVKEVVVEVFPLTSEEALKPLEFVEDIVESLSDLMSYP